MNYRISLLSLLIIAFLITITSCEDFLDVNENPNVINEAPEPLRLSGLLSNFSYQTIAGAGTRYPALWMKQISFNGSPPTEDNYDINATDINGVWTGAYDDAMINAKTLNALAESNGNNGYAAIAKTILAWSAVYTSNLYGSIPYSEALQGGENTEPAYDSQESIYVVAQDSLDAALADLENGNLSVSPEHDFIYSGEMEKWERLIYALKARFHMNLTNAPGYSAEEQAQKALDALANAFLDNTDDAVFPYFNSIGSENPWYQWGVDGKWFDSYRLSKHYVEMLKSFDDPRLPVQARPNSEGEYRGHENGAVAETNNLISIMGEFYAAPEADVTWISYAEVKFMEAEANLILNGAAAADPIYRDAIRASMNKLDIDDNERESYVNSQPVLTSTTALQDIITQKYIANYLNISAYNDWRRTGYPELTLAANAVVDNIPLRFVVPNSELENNLENLEATGIPLGQDAMSVPVWWDSEN